MSEDKPHPDWRTGGIRFGKRGAACFFWGGACYGFDAACYGSAGLLELVRPRFEFHMVELGVGVVGVL